MVYNRYKINTFTWVFKRIAKSRLRFITVHERPMLAAKIGTWSDQLKTAPKVAIVLQGPLISEADFTLETVKLYKKHYRDATIIVSTNTGADITTINQLITEGAIVVENQKPVIVGIGNVNLQLASTLGGLSKAKQLGAEFVYKTRCDQRMYAVNVTEFLLNLVHAFPVALGYTQKYRIVASSFVTLKYVPYLVTDMFQFGQIDDMIQYWSATHDLRSTPTTPIRTVADVTSARIAESYLATEFLTRIGRKVGGTIADSWAAYAEHFCIVDRETLDLFWYKYDFYREYQMKDYGGVSNSQLLTFAEWFNLYRGCENKSVVPEGGLTRTRQDYVPEPTII
jgi:hypothetical protein